MKKEIIFTDIQLIDEGFKDMVSSGRQSISRYWNPSSSTTSSNNQTSDNNAANATSAPSGQSVATTASKQAAGTSAAKGGGRVQPKAGIVDVRRATYGKIMLALQAAGIDDVNTQKQVAELLITNVIIPYLTVNLVARGISVTDLRSKKSAEAPNPVNGKRKVVTISENLIFEVVEEESELDQVRDYYNTKTEQIQSAKSFEDIEKIIQGMPSENYKNDYLRTIQYAIQNPQIFIAKDFSYFITAAGGFREKVLDLLNNLQQNSNQKSSSFNIPKTTRFRNAIPKTKDAQNTLRTKIDPNQPIRLFTGNDSLLQRMNVFMKSRAPQLVKGLNKIDTNNTQVQDQFKQIIKDLVDQLKINGLTNKQIQENFNFSDSLLSESQINRWKVLAKIIK